MTTAVAVALIATGTFQRLVAIVVVLSGGELLRVLPRARRAAPARAASCARPFRAWGYPWSAGFVLAGAAVFMAGAVAGDTVNAGGALGAAVCRPGRTSRDADVRAPPGSVMAPSFS